MKRIFLFSIFVSGLLIQCGPPRAPILSAEQIILRESVPTKLTVQPGNKKLYLKWNTNCPKGVVLSGYNIYILREPLEQKFYDPNPPAKIKAFNSLPYPGDTESNGNYETMKIETLDNGIEYFITVRTVYPNGAVSAASNEVSAIGRPEGKFSLSFRYAGLNDGFCFAKGLSVRADADDNDIYFFQKDGFDFAASPHRLNGFLRESSFYSLGKTRDIYQYPLFKIDIPPVEKIPILVGESYLVKMADGHYAKIRIEKATGQDKERILEIRYIYQTVKNLIRF
ncbi:MAG: hypothetical protein NTV06_00980 [candidate division Zixibacteria bacterium]|nr:hypothetical protein [candidate division Zixibacteria bacterium]